MPPGLPLVPAPDPIPLPAPPWVFVLAMGVFFFLHAIAMNFVLGGGIVTLATLAVGRRRPTERLQDAGAQMVFWLPIVTAVAVNFGVATLLFVQTLYGTFFYTSSVLLAVPWLSIVGVLIVVYYGYYAGFYGRRVRGPWILIVQGLSVVGFAYIAFVFVNNLTLMMDPGRWAAIYRPGPYGMRLNLGEPTLWPRYLHILNGAIAVGGLGTLFLGMYDLVRGGAGGRWKVAYGARWAIGATLVQYGLGVWFVLSLPAGVRSLLLGGHAFGTGALAAGILLSVVALAMLGVAARAREPLRFAGFGATALLGTVAAMVVVRQVVRQGMLAPYLTPFPMSVQTQGWAIAIFLVAFVVGAAAIGYCLLKLLEKGEVHEPA